MAGHGRIAMADLREVFRAAGAREVSTFIQTGNVLFEATQRDLPRIRRAVQAEMKRRMGEEVPVFYRTRREYEKLVAAAPFDEIEPGEDAKLYVSFLERRTRRRPSLPLHVEKEGLTLTKVEARQAYLLSHPKANGFYGFPNELVEKELAVAATSRNWSTVTRIAERLKI